MFFETIKHLFILERINDIRFINSFSINKCVKDIFLSISFGNDVNYDHLLVLKSIKDIRLINLFGNDINI
uniref:Uncharacterized protein n=1 Tax=Physcomitrium patens TaxID=3218 RepID=A0A2K1K6D1_PHYPA|nr:hypothetical protein PHYPA_011223 [Physcomitrium patens]